MKHIFGYYIHLTLYVAICYGLDSKDQSAPKLYKKQFVTLHKWSNLEMTFPTKADLDLALKKGFYERSKTLPVDVDVEYGDDGYHRTFLTIPRLSLGIPYSLATVADNDNATILNPKLAPYPNYSWHIGHGLNCSLITSAIRTYIDECWRLWVVDSGQINSLQYCPPQILAFDLVSDTLLHRYTLPRHLYTPGVSVFTALAVDVGEAEPRAECRDTMVYIADPWGYGLIVYDALKKRSWRIQHKTMRPDRSLFSADSASSGIFTVSITPKATTEPQLRQLYFHALNSYKEVSISLQLVNNMTMWLLSRNRNYDKYFKTLGTRGTQCESEIMDNSGHLYCSLISANAIISWDPKLAYNSDNLKVVAFNPDQLKFVTGLKINRNSIEDDELWALSNEPQLFIGNALKTDAIKFQIIGCRTKDLLENTACTVGLTSFAKKNGV